MAVFSDSQADHWRTMNGFRSSENNNNRRGEQKMKSVRGRWLNGQRLIVGHQLLTSEPPPQETTRCVPDKVLSASRAPFIRRLDRPCHV